MARQAPTPDQLFDRLWRPGRRFALAGGRVRRWMMVALLLLLCAVISGYGYLTDSNRVRAMAESYLSGLAGGPVKVGGATLSIFEGLRLDDVRLYVDDQTTAPDSLLFSAQTFLIKYDPRTMLAGRLEATQIVAQKPQVHLTDNRDVAEWNYERLARRRRLAPLAPGGPPGPVTSLPEIKLRNARVSISEIRGGREATRGLVAVDGQLTPSADGDRFTFHLQSRGVSEGIGPYATGSVSLSTGQIVAQLMNFEFDRDVRSMLPAEPRDWWQRHELAGAVSMPEISFTPGKGGSREQFKLVTVLNGVTLSISPEEWMGQAEVTRLQGMRKTAAMMGRLYAYGGKGSVAGGQGPAGGSASPLTPESRLLTPSDRLSQLLQLSKVTLKNVAGTFVFTNTGIEVKDVSGFVESNGLKINGRIDGYRPEAPISLRVASFDTENLKIPAAPRYISSLPYEVREVYEQFKPEGECRIGIRIDRVEPGARPVVGGWVEILDGRFVFSRFAYPLRNVTGRIEFGRAGGTDRLSLDLRGNGPATSPNRDAVLEIKSFGDEIAPIGTNVCGVNVRITGTNVTMEDALRNAFAPEVRQALANFDAHRTGQYPQFRGDFVTEVVRPVGHNRRWGFDTDLVLRDASGAIAAFPYPLHDLGGTLRIRSGYADLVDFHMKHGDATLAANGRVAWTTTDGPRGPQQVYRANGARLSPRVDEAVKTGLKVAVRNLPIDNELLAAIPKDRREAIRQLGASGKLDVDGRIFPTETGPAATDIEWVVGGKADEVGPLATAQDVTPGTPAGGLPSTMGYDLKLTIRDGAFRPFGGAFDASAVGATLRLTPTRLAIERVTARRGEAELRARGNIDWPNGKPRIVVDASADAIALDEPLYRLIPEPARHGWDEVQPHGTADVEVHYDSAALEATRSMNKSLAAQPIAPPGAAADATPSGLRVVLKPRKLAATLKSVPYRLEDLTGVVTVDGGRVTLEQVTGKHGDGKVSVSGAGVIGAKPVWDVRLGGEKLPVDDDLRRALPPTLAGLIDALKLKGSIGFDLTRFVYRSAEEPGVGSQESGVRSQESDEKVSPLSSLIPDSRLLSPEIDVVGSLNLHGGSLDVGVPMTEVGGVVKIDAAVRDGHLETLRGGIHFDSLSMAGRAATNFRGDLFKPPGRSELHLSKMRCEVAGGAMSGQMTLAYPDDGASRYSLELVVRDADVRALAWENDDTTATGRLTASLSLEGSWGDAAQRRGRGDVIVSGRELKRIPLVLGLLQVTNLALPLSSPFNEATAVYSFDGTRVMFESIRLKASNMLMEGEGSLDFKSKRVALTFTTDNPNGLMNLPFLKDLWRGARNEMLKIHVRGTIQEPEISTQSMGTFWTTVDEVFNGKDNPEPTENKKRVK